MTTDLGASFRRKSADYGPLADLVSGLRADITAEVRAAILTEVASIVTDAVSKIRPPTVNVPPPQVSIAAPAVTVTPTFSPQITVEGDAGEITAINRQTVVLEKLSTQMAALYTLLSQTVTRHVIRDSNGFITEVTEQR